MKIGEGTMTSGLYTKNLPCNRKILKKHEANATIKTYDEATKWHLRMKHPSDRILKQMFSSLGCSTHVCEASISKKMTHLPFENYKYTFKLFV